MKILYSPASPYSAKVRMGVRFAGLDVAHETVSTEEKPDILVSNNPLGKIPVLLTDDGHAIYDSRSIMHFADRESGGRLYPADPAARTKAEVLEALCDGITDCLIAFIYEKRFHPPEKVHQPWLDRQWDKVSRGLDYLTDNPPSLRDGLNAGHFSLAALVGYLALRFPGQWEERWSFLSAFAAEFQAAFPDYETLKPQ
jgi:glutathione S-transferase